MTTPMTNRDFSLTPHFAKIMVTQVMSLLGRDVSIVGSDGTVLASYDPGLVGSQPAGIERVLKANDVVELPDGRAVGFAIKQQEHQLGALLIHAEPKVVQEFIPLTRSLVGLLVEQESRHALAGNLDQLLWQLFHSLSDAERERLVNEAKLLGIDLGVPRFVVLFSSAGFSDKLAKAADKEPTINRFKEKLNREVSAIFPSSSANVITYFGHDVFLLLKDATKGEETVEMFRQKAPQMLQNIGDTTAAITAGIGNLYLGVAGLLTSFKEAEAALRLGGKLHGSGRPYYVDDLGMYVVFSDVATDRQLGLAKKLLAPLLQEPDLLKTIRAYFEQNLSLTKAAETLHIHRNTLIYRLNKIKELVKLDPEVFEDAVQIRLAVMLLDLEQ